MPVSQVNDPDTITRVETIITPGTSAYAGQITFGVWVAQTAGKSLTTVQQTMENALLAWYGTGADGLRELMPSNAQIVGTRYSKPLDPQGEVPLVIARALVGTAATAEHCPPETSAVLSWRSDTKGPAFRGRSYVAPVSVSNLDPDGFLSNAIAVELQAASDDFRLAMEGPTVEQPLVALSRFVVDGQETVARVPPLMAPVVGVQVDRHSDTQRRRGAK